MDNWPAEHQYLLSIDESGTDDIKGIHKRLETGQEIPIGDRYLAITGVVMERMAFPTFRNAILGLKRSYWPPDGLFPVKGDLRRVCFHSTAIRKRTDAFSPTAVNYPDFINDLSMILRDTPATVIASVIDKVKEVRQYPDPKHEFGHPYGLGMTFILERFSFFLKAHKATGVILLEGRGLHPDKFVLNYVVNLLQNGTRYLNPQMLSRIKGVYFAPKWHPDNAQTSFLTLELADLFCYPIYQFVRDGQRGKSFDVVEKKFYNYPAYQGYGLKIFP